MALTERERFESFAKLSEMGFDRLHKRREYEWKINFGIWTVLAVMIGFGATDSKDLKVDLPGFLFLAMHVVVLIIYAVWTTGLQLSNKVDQRFGFHYEDRAEDLVSDSTGRFDHQAISSSLKRVGGPRTWAILSQVAFTVLLLASDVATYWSRLRFCD